MRKTRAVARTDERWWHATRDAGSWQTGAIATAAALICTLVAAPGAAAYLAPAETLSSPHQRPKSIAIADVNGDAINDLVSVAFGPPSAMFVRRGNGDGTFQTPVSYPGGSSFESVAVGDLTGDGRPDVVAGGLNAGGAHLYVNNGSGLFTTRIQFAPAARPRRRR